MLAGWCKPRGLKQPTEDLWVFFSVGAFSEIAIHRFAQRLAVTFDQLSTKSHCFT
jgi:hypothetical protein